MSPAERIRLRGLLQWLLTHMHQIPDVVLAEALKCLEGVQHQERKTK